MSIVYRITGQYLSELGGGVEHGERKNMFNFGVNPFNTVIYRTSLVEILRLIILTVLKGQCVRLRGYTLFIMMFSFMYNHPTVRITEFSLAYNDLFIST